MSQQQTASWWSPIAWIRSAIDHIAARERQAGYNWAAGQLLGRGMNGFCVVEQILEDALEFGHLSSFDIGARNALVDYTMLVRSTIE